FKLAGLSLHPHPTVIDVGGIKIGSKQITIMAGPCAIESPLQIQEIANLLKNEAVHVLRGSAYKPRTSPYSFQGMGDEGIKLHAEEQKEHGMLIETEVMDVRKV